MRTMSPWPGLVCAATVITMSGCRGVGLPPDAATEAFELSSSFDDVGTVMLDWRSGRVNVRIDPAATDITASGTKQAIVSSREDAEAALDDLQVSVVVSDATPAQVTLSYDEPDVPGLYSVEIDVVVPAGVDLRVDSRNGDVTVRDNVGPCRIDLDNGEIRVVNQSGQVDINLNNGAVEVESLAGAVDVDVDQGAIDVVAAPDSSTAVTVRTGIGTVDVRVPADTAASLTLRGRVGSVEAELDEFMVTDLDTSAQQLTCTLNGGGGQIVAESEVGRIRFRAR